MAYGTNGLSFRTLREANKRRLPQFKNSQGLPAHTEADGSDWSLAEWLQATVGELGELANLLKKVRRGDISMEDAMPEVRREFADVQTYLDIFAMRAGVDLGDATIEKFNEVSRRVGAKVFLGYDDDWHHFDPDGAKPATIRDYNT
jgi:NTP pyrophosphatase (non-canonical NTP hydrolase)